MEYREISNYEIDKLYVEVYCIANIIDNGVGSGAKITGVGKGGMVLFALPYGQYRNEIEKIIDSDNIIRVDITSHIYYLIQAHQTEKWSGVATATLQSPSPQGLELLHPPNENATVKNRGDVPAQSVLQAGLNLTKNV